MTTNSDWWDNYHEEPYHKSGGGLTIDIECPEKLERPIGFFRLRERVRVKVFGVRWEIKDN